MKTIHLIAAARPNFMKIAPLYHQLKKIPYLKPVIVHTGQHYDANMSDAFFEDLKLPSPDINLGVHGGAHAESVGNTMIQYENICNVSQPDLVVVVGDVNATMACAITAKKMNFRVAHLEAGIRSFDMSMPEEINRKVTDSIVDFYWTPSVDANENLVCEGVAARQIKFVGNVMIDSLEMLRDSIEEINFFNKYHLDKKNYGIATFHRPANVDTRDNLIKLIEMLKDASNILPVVFPIHPRTRSRLISYGLFEELQKSRVIIEDPLSYKQFMSLVINSGFVLTDSGGIQEETTYLGIPCITFRDNTERPVTISEGTNTLAKLSETPELINSIMSGSYKKGKIPLLWDGCAAVRIVEHIKAILGE